VTNICIKIHAIGKEIMVAACDFTLLEKTLKKGDFVFHISKDFYDDFRGNENLLKRYLETATIANLVGEKCVKCGIELGIIIKENVVYIDGIPHAQFAAMV
jgi:hypothetical protein